MLVFAHGGVHGRLTTNYAHIFREALERGFVIVSPEYRGSIGHGGDLYSQSRKEMWDFLARHLK